MATAAEAAAAAEAEGVAAAEAAAAEETTKRRTVMVVGIEDSEHSYYALGWTLRRFFGGGAAASGIDLVIVHAKPSPANVVNLAGPGAPDVLPFVESDLRAIAAGVVAKARELCATNSVSALVEVVEGMRGMFFVKQLKNTRQIYLLWAAMAMEQLKELFWAA
uniref:UspA domain-containing protein n=1 Tax=Ananas comosus var. bracteatus TaxID=296719 RepID=A0A6V7PRW7_ANACO|nr:unnamed protein product [Ananas comosus var. bracteatus]